MRIFLLILAFPALLGAQTEQCSLDTIVFGSHNYIYNTRFDIPTTIRWTGYADSIRVSITGLDYPFNNKVFLVDEQTDTVLHDLTFTVFDTCESISNWLVYNITISGANCPQTKVYNDSVLYVVPGCFEYDQPQGIIICNSVLTLSDSVTSGGLYYANDTIITSQILARNNYIYEALNFTLSQGFYVADSVSFFLDPKSCN